MFREAQLRDQELLAEAHYDKLDEKKEEHGVA